MCARACMHACVCVRVWACSHIDRKIIWFINYVMMQSVNYIILSSCLSTFFSIYLSIYAHIRTHTYIHVYVCVCVCVCVCVFGCSHIRRRKEFYLSKALTHE